MANLVNGDKIKVNIYTEIPSRSQKATMGVYYTVTDIVGAWTPLTVAGALSQSHSPLFRAWMSSLGLYRETGVKRVSPTVTPESKSTLGQGFGTNGAAQLPTQVTGLIVGKADVYHTGSPTDLHPAGVQILASCRNYISFPALVTGGSTEFDGRMRPSQITQLNTIASTLYSPRFGVNVGGATITLTPQIRYGVKTLPPTVVTNYTYVGIATLSASPLWATQQRRGDRGKREQTN